MSHPFKPIDAFKSPRFSQIATFMRLPHHRTAADLDVALLGIPYDGGTSYRAGARFGPREIRSQSAMIRPWNPVLKVSPYEALRIADYGDIDISPVSIERTNEIVEQEIGAILAAGCLPVSVGGDHSIALPILRALARRHGPVALVHFDSHPDTWDQYFGSRYFHGTMFRRAVEERLIDPRRTFQIAIRGPLYGSDDFDFQAEHGMTVVRVEAIKERGVDWVVEQYAKLRGRRSTCRSTSTRSTRRTRRARGRPRWAGSRPTRRSRWSGGSAASTSWASTSSRWRPSTTARARSRPSWRRTSSSSFSRWSRSTARRGQTLTSDFRDISCAASSS